MDTKRELAEDRHRLGRIADRLEDLAAAATDDNRPVEAQYMADAAAAVIDAAKQVDAAIDAVG